MIPITIYVQPGVFERVEGISGLLNSGTILEFYQNKTKGMTIASGNASKDRVGSFIVKGKNINEVKSKIVKAFEEIIIYDKDSNIMKYSYGYDNLLLD